MDFVLISGASFFFLRTWHTLVSTLLLKHFDPSFTKLYENVCWHKMEAKFDNQLNPTRHFGVMDLGILKNSDFVLISGSFFFIWTLHTLVSAL